MTVAFDIRGWKDSLVNLMAGFGVPGRDKAAPGGSFFNYMPLTQFEMESAYRSNWLARKLIDIPAQDATRAWRVWQADTNEVEVLEAEEVRLDVQVTLKNAIIMSRLYGGAALILGVNQGKASAPLVLENVDKGDLQFVVAASRYALGNGPIIKDVFSPDYGKPEYFTRNMAGQEAGSEEVRIHPSRVVMLKGMTTPDPISTGEIWGDSVLQVTLDAVQSATLVTQSVASLVTEAKFDIIKIPDLSQNISTAEYQNQLTARFMYANSMKSIINTLVLDKEEEWDRVTASFAQLPDILQMYLLIASGAADIPATRMLGQSPAGFQSTGESDVRNYYDRVNSDQVNVLSPALATLDDVLIRSALGSRDPSLYYVWNPLWQMAAPEKAAVAKLKADTFSVDANTAIVDQEALRIGRQNQLIEDGTYPGLEQALEQQEQLDLESMESVEEQEAQAEQERRQEMAMASKQANAGQAFPGGAKKPPGKKAPAKDARPITAGRRARKMGWAKRWWKNADYNPNPEWTKGGGGLFSGSEAGSGTGGTSSLVRNGVMTKAHAESYADMRREYLQINDSVLGHLDDDPDTPMLRGKMSQLQELQKNMRRLDADTGGIEGIGLPGGARDVIVVGGGPGGLGCGLNAAYDGLDVLVVEAQQRTGGQSKTSGRLENVGGFPWGVRGATFAEKMRSTAEKNGAEVRTGTRVMGITYDKGTGLKTVHFENGESAQARVVVLAGGVVFRTMTFDGSDGPGISYGDGETLVKDGKGGPVVIIGGSNGAAQAASTAAKSSSHVYILSRSPISKGMSGNPKDTVLGTPNITVIENDEIAKLVRDADGNPTTVVTKEGRELPAAALGLFIGQAPANNWLPDTIERDEKGFIRSDPDFRTSMPGVYAVGDVRANGPARVQTSQAEGQMATANMFRYWAAEKDARDDGIPLPHERAWGRSVKIPMEQHTANLQAIARHAERVTTLEARLRAAGLSTDAKMKAHGGPKLPRGGMSLSEWDDLVDELYALDRDNPSLVKCIEFLADEGDKGRLVHSDVEDDWNEEDHPRGFGGKFGHGTGTAQTKPTKGRGGKKEVQRTSFKPGEKMPGMKGMSGLTIKADPDALELRELLGPPEDRPAKYAELKRSGAPHAGRSYTDAALVDENGIIHTDDVTDVARALYEGKKVNLIDHGKVAVSIDYLGKVSSKMAKMGAKAKTFDLCNATVEGSNLFCSETKGIPRVEMPQLKGTPTEGSIASKMEADERGEVDINDAFRAHLLENGYEIEDTAEHADLLKATQNELDGAKIAGIANAIRGAPGARPYIEASLFVSSDNYIVDGHHRWAAKVAVDFDDGKPGDVTQPISRVNASIVELLDLSRNFASEMGIPQVGVAHVAPSIKEKKAKDAFFFSRGAKTSLLEALAARGWHVSE